MNSLSPFRKSVKTPKEWCRDIEEYRRLSIKNYSKETIRCIIRGKVPMEFIK